MYIKKLKKKYKEKWKNAYLIVRNVRASRALRRALDPSQYYTARFARLTSLAQLRFATSAKSRKKILGPPWPNPRSATGPSIYFRLFMICHICSIISSKSNFTYLYAAVNKTISSSNQSLISINPNPKMSIVALCLYCISQSCDLLWRQSWLLMSCLLFHIPFLCFAFSLKRIFKCPSGPILVSLPEVSESHKYLWSVLFHSQITEMS